MLNIDTADLTRKLNIGLFQLDVNARIRLWRKLSKLLSDGISIIAALEELRSTRNPSDAMYIALDEWIRVLNNGRKFSDAVRDWVTKEEYMLLMAGDESGMLAKTLDSVVKITKAKKSIQGAIVGGLAYPTFLFILAFAVLYLFGFKIIPAFSSAARGDHWTGLARMMVDAAGFIQNWYYVLVVIAVAVVTGIVVSMPLWTGQMRTKFDRYPPYSIYRVTQGASWIIALSSLVQAGMRIEAAMEQLMKDASPWAKERIGAALAGLRAGRNLGQALMATGLEFPDREIISDIRVYSNKSGFDEALRIIGDEWIAESVERISTMMRSVFSTALLMAASLIGFMVMGMFAMQTQLTQILQKN